MAPTERAREAGGASLAPPAAPGGRRCRAAAAVRSRLPVVQHPAAEHRQRRRKVHRRHRGADRRQRPRSEEHTSELQSLMRISYAVFCLKKKKKNTNTTTVPLADINKIAHM